MIYGQKKVHGSKRLRTTDIVQTTILFQHYVYNKVRISSRQRSYLTRMVTRLHYHYGMSLLQQLQAVDELQTWRPLAESQMCCSAVL